MYRIGTVAELVGIPRNTLLAWERRYQLLVPDRSEAGYRLYTDGDLDVLRRVKVYLDQGYRISEAIALLERDARTASDVPISLRETLRDRLLAFDRAGAEVACRGLATFSFAQTIDEVYAPLLIEVGGLWHDGTISVAQEHHVSAFCREQLLTMLHSLGSGPESGPRAVCAGFPGEVHELGLLITAVKLALAGWRVIYLGADLANEELAEAARSQNARLVCQSAVLQRPAAELLEHAAELRSLVDPVADVAIGGPAVAGLEGEVDGVWFCQDVEELAALLT